MRGRRDGRRGARDGECWCVTGEACWGREKPCYRIESMGKEIIGIRARMSGRIGGFGMRVKRQIGRAHV